MAKAVKSHRNRIHDRPGLNDGYAATKTLYNQLVAFYFELYQAHPGLLELSAQKALTQAEKLSHRTKTNPEPLWPLAETVKADVPAMAAGGDQCRSRRIQIVQQQPQPLAQAETEV